MCGCATLSILSSPSVTGAVGTIIPSVCDAGCCCWWTSSSMKMFSRMRLRVVRSLLPSRTSLAAEDCKERQSEEMKRWMNCIYKANDQLTWDQDFKDKGSDQLTFE